jgi:light-regulated signal transduction histidine kinase (bacteriophytochrome)
MRTAELLALQEAQKRLDLCLAGAGLGIWTYNIATDEESSGRTEYDRQASGIGLSLVQKLVKLHSGTIAVSSVEGEGIDAMQSEPVNPNDERERFITVRSVRYDDRFRIPQSLL